MERKEIGHSESDVCPESMKRAHTTNNGLGLLFGPWKQKRNVWRGPRGHRL